MSADREFVELFSAKPSQAARVGPWKETPAESEEGSCPAFGFLRGLQDRALAVEFRFRTGDREWFAYSLLASWRHHPSTGLLLKFAGDVVTYVLIRGSNLDLQVGDAGVNLTDRGLQRHRILWVREMDEDELRTAGEGGPSIDGLTIVDFESHQEAQEWLKKTAPEFVRK